MMYQPYWKTRTITAATLAILLAGITAQATELPEIPYASALQRANVVQEKMATEIPGALILGNGDLNGILWVNRGRLRFSITKNDACDGRLDMANDPAESHNLATTHPEITRKMQRQLRDWQASVLNSLSGADYE